ncbi:MAG TPA: penicillin acylase family protein [Flavobacterium sp.]|uniref:penicillin acylase family protein n=1 Tax=unclassified Flavobacterium TaxID=196869 RepID=UPI000E828A58|nr:MULTISPECIES: penicillin acylase family protein [unclassified Flavobacterium]HBI00999.1 penicillin acylase family protein [Flavobacterium sp.]HRE77388.1 penicillin acylase family protein [Flavobacterium sp.]
MKLLKKISLSVLLILVLIAAFILIYGFYLKPKYDGEIALNSIQKETTVYFDDYGVPHIYAQSQKDAMTTLGYVHAQDRLWQMELMRRIAPGRLSELFGSVMLKNDKFFAGLGIDEDSEKAIAQLDKNSESYQLTLAYLGGINQFLEEGPSPIEFQLVGVPKEKFTIKDVYNIFGYMSFSFAMAQKSDPLMTDIRDELGMDYLKDFGIDGSLAHTKLKSFKGKSEAYSEISKSVASLLENSPVPPFIGSNSWVVGPQKTKSGKVLFANDPHIGFSQPCTWYEAHIVTPDYEMYGYYLAGTPFPLLGHNRQYAYGLTMFENDDMDLFLETNNPENENQYQTKEGFNNYQIIEKVIKVKDSSDVVLKVKKSHHGPLLNGLVDGLKEDKPISMWWTYLQHKNQILDAVYSLCHAKNVEDFHQSIELIAAPGLNIMYGDAKGNIAWITSGKLYKMPENVNPNFILNGANGEDEQKEYYEFSENPYAINPTCNYVYSANNQVEPIDDYLYPGYYLPEDRAKRIVQLLEPKNDWTKEDFMKMINDDQSSVAPSIVQSILSGINQNDLSENEKNALNQLKNWNGSNGLTDVAPTIYNQFLFYYLKNTFEDELGKDRFDILLTTHLLKQMIAFQIANEESPWWDNSSTKDKKESRNEILTLSFQQTISNLEKKLGNQVSGWTWNKVHTVEHKHPLGEVAALRSYFNVGPFEINGSNEVINNLMFTFTEAGNHQVKAGPSTRRIIDFSDIQNSVSILPTGQSGNPLSEHYKNQAELYNQGKFRKMKMNKKEIEASSRKLVFKPR